MNSPVEEKLVMCRNWLAELKGSPGKVPGAPGAVTERARLQCRQEAPEAEEERLDSEDRHT
jgi:hypothetical protein